MNTTERDQIIFGSKPLNYFGGVEHFKGLTIDKIKTLVEKGYLDPSASFNLTPEYSDFIDFIETHPGFTAHGFVVEGDREDCRMDFEGIEARRTPPDPEFDLETIRDFVSRYRSADEFEWEPDQLYCWYD